MEGIPGSTDEAPRHDVRAWVSLVVAVVLAVALGLLAAGFVADAASSHRANAGASRAVDAILGVVCIGLTALCGRWAVHAEHRLRHRNPVAASYAAGPFGTLTPEPSGLGGSTGLAAPSVTFTPTPFDTTTAAHLDTSTAATPDTPVTSVEPARPTSSRTPRRPRSYGPVVLGIITAVFTVFAIGLIIGTLISISQASRSSYVQNHGLRTLGTVTFVNDIQHCSSNGTSCSYTAQIDVTLHPPVDGASSTVVYAPFSSSLNAGDTVTVLVDPHDLTYGELPGSPYVTSEKWIILGAVAVVLILLDVLCAFALVDVLRHRRSMRAVGAPAPAV